ncbi:MAG: zf-HC2 domain-containing protein [Actinobacteria bacterium]|nr:zf-HC2 domain-containing protein [Actinomycetota bacterium]
MITCAEAVKQLWSYLDQTLDRAEREGVREHLSFCRTCCGEVEFAQELQKFMSSQRSDEIPSDVRIRLESLLEEMKER